MCSYIPSVWFLELHQALLEGGATGLPGTANLAVLATTVVFVFALSLYALTYYRHFMRIKSVVIAFIILLVVIALGGATYQWNASRKDLAATPPPGYLVDIGGHRLHIWCMGSGTPAVILDSGLGGGAFDWPFVQPEVAKFTQFCAYDRAGMGYSDPGPKPRTSRQIAEELAVLIQNSGIDGRVRWRPSSTDVTQTVRDKALSLIGTRADIRGYRRAPILPSLQCAMRKSISEDWRRRALNSLVVAQPSLSVALLLARCRSPYLGLPMIGRAPNLRIAG